TGTTAHRTALPSTTVTAGNPPRARPNGSHRHPEASAAFKRTRIVDRIVAASPLARPPGAVAASGRATGKAGTWPGDHFSSGHQSTALRSPEARLGLLVDYGRGSAVGTGGISDRRVN